MDRIWPYKSSLLNCSNLSIVPANGISKGGRLVISILVIENVDNSTREPLEELEKSRLIGGTLAI